MTLILLLIKDILKTHLYRGNNLLKTLTAVFVSMFSLCSAQSVETRADAGQSAKKITRENIPFFVDIIDKKENSREQLMYYPNADLEKYPVFQYRAKIDRIRPLKVGKNVPDEIWDLPVRIVGDIRGRDSITLRELAADKILVLDFWAKWCSPCLKSMNKWKELQPKYKGEVQVVGLMLDWDYKAELMIHKMGWNMPQLIGPEVYLLNYYFCGTPVTGPSAWINKGKFIGLSDARADSEKIINNLLLGLPPSFSENGDRKLKKGKEEL
ncbi:redoxin domain-containing protein [Sphingobacterium sp. HMA12]|uniref:TlpA family protein disulfide reductase n=1 Tax=Sphingobacterium sp. HMA12 TaxID=2050894 RepID=UPI000CEA4CD6|nr:redoxin domain-containing protein [Sphingobacterium sp. HMA12]